MALSVEATAVPLGTQDSPGRLVVARPPFNKNRDTKFEDALNSLRWLALAGQGSGGVKVDLAG